MTIINPRPVLYTDLQGARNHRKTILRFLTYPHNEAMHEHWQSELAKATAETRRLHVEWLSMKGQL